MRFGIRLKEREITFEEKPPTGVLLPQNFPLNEKDFREEGVSLHPLSINIKIFIDKKNPYPLSPTNWNYILKISQLLGYFEKGVLFLGRKIFLELSSDLHFVYLTQYTVLEIFGSEIWENFLTEIGLGSFNSEDLSLLESLFGPSLMERFENFLKTTPFLLTRIVGFRHYAHNFERENNSLIVKPGDKIFLVHENNEKDPFAIAVLWKNGEKLGYLRKNLAQFLIERFKKGDIPSGEIIEVFPSSDDNEKVFIKIDF